MELLTHRKTAIKWMIHKTKIRCNISGSQTSAKV
jgi:hypothetical protein